MLQGGRVRESGMDMYTLLYLKWITKKQNKTKQKNKMDNQQGPTV